MNPHADTQGERYVVNRLKLEIENWLQTYGQIQIGEENIKPLHEVIDDTYKEILRVREANKIPDRC